MLLSLTWRKLSVSGGRKLSGTGTGTRLCVAAPGPGLRSSDPGPVRVTAGDVPVPLRNDQTLHAFQRHVCVSPRVFVHPGGTRKHPQLLPLPAGLRDTPWDPDWGSGSGLASVSGCVKTGTRTGTGTVDLLGVRGVFTGDYWGVYTTRRLHGSTTWTMQTGSMQTRSMQTRSGSTKSSGAGETQQNNNNKGVNDEQNVTTTTTKTSSSSSPSEEAEVGALTKTQQLKKVFKEYGAVGVTFHIGISLMSLGMFYLLVSSGIDMAAVLCKVGFSEAVVRSKMAAGTSTFVLAYAVHKLFAPLRISVTLVSVPLIVRYFRKVGHFKPPTPAP